MVHVAPPKGFSPKFEVVSCFLDHNGEFLILHRRPEKSEGDKWGIPAGKAERSETIRRAILREVEGETGIRLTDNQVVFLETLYVRYFDYDFIYHIFRTELMERPLIDISTGEHQGFRWVSPEEALRMNLVTDEDTCIKRTYALADLETVSAEV